MTTKEELRAIALEDGRFSPEALLFLFEALPEALRLAGKEGAEGAERHIDGRDVLRGLQVHAQRTFGPLAAHVWRSWGVHRALDWGRIVFLLVEKDRLNRQDTDTLDDFRVEAIPEGPTFLVRNVDRPGVVGRLGTLLGDAHININRMQLGLHPETGKAMQLVSVDPAPSDEVVRAVRSLDGVESVQLLDLGEKVT